MKGKTLVVLTGVAFLAAATAFWLDRGRSPASLSGDGEPLFAGFGEQINDVREIRLSIGGSEQGITLSRDDSGWRVAERYGYAADAGAIRRLLLKLSEARVVEPKTSNPDLYARLGVEDVSAVSGEGVLLAIDGPAVSRQLIIGEVETLAGRGTYVRRPGEQPSYLVSEEMRPARSPEKWLDPDLLDVPPSLMKTVTIRHDDGEELRLLGIDGHLALDRIPEGRALSSPSATSPIGRSLEDLRLEDVLPESAFDGGTPAAVISYRLADGRLVNVRAWQIGDQRFVALQLGMALDADAPAPAESESDGGQGPEDESAAAEVPRADAETVARHSEKLAGWVFRIPVTRYDQMVRRPDDLLSPLPEGG